MTVTDASETATRAQPSTRLGRARASTRKALSFNGTSSRVTIPDTASLHLSSAMTLEAWVSLGGHQQVARRDHEGQRQLLPRGDFEQVERPAGGAIIGGSTTEAIGTTALPVNTLDAPGSHLRRFRSTPLRQRQPHPHHGEDGRDHRVLQRAHDRQRPPTTASTSPVSSTRSASTTRPSPRPRSRATWPQPSTGRTRRRLRCPGRFRRRRSRSRLDLAWGAATDNLAVTGYRIERCQGAACTNFVQIAAPAGTATSYSDTTVVDATSYSYRVRAVDAAATSAPTATPHPARRPTRRRPPRRARSLRRRLERPDRPRLDRSHRQRRPITGYLIERCQGTACTNFAQIAAPEGTATAYSDTGVAASTTYRYRVRATDAAANVSVYGNIAAGSTPAGSDTQAPSAPGTLTATAVSSSRIDLAWGAATDNVAVTSYLVERCQGTACTDFAQIAAPSGTGTAYNDASVGSATSYRYRVRATDAVPNLGAYGNIAAATTPAGVGSRRSRRMRSTRVHGRRITDASGTGNTGTAADTDLVELGQYGKALSFTGVGSRVTILDSASRLSPRRLEAWVNPAQRELARRDHEGQRQLLPGGQDRTPAASYTAARSSAAATPIDHGTAILKAGRWTHLALTYDGFNLGSTSTAPSPAPRRPQVRSLLGDRASRSAATLFTASTTPVSSTRSASTTSAHPRARST